MYGAVFLRSRSCGVLMNAEQRPLTTWSAGGHGSDGDAAGWSQPAAGVAPTHSGAASGGFAPRSRLVRPGEPGIATCGTPVLCSRLSVKSGPPWHSMQPPLPWKSFSPRSAAGDIVPSSKDVAGGASVPREATSWGAGRPPPAAQGADGGAPGPPP